jgi:hypothetical protein
MDFRKEFVVEPGAKVHLSKINPSHKGEYESFRNSCPPRASAPAAGPLQPLPAH